MAFAASAGLPNLTAKNAHTCTITKAGGAACWGYNVLGQVGDGTIGNRLLPVMVSGLSSGVVAISAGGFHTCALTTGGGVKCWGDATYGQLGDGRIAAPSSSGSSTPVDVIGLSSGVVAISSGSEHSCAITVAGSVKCWGRNLGGRLGDGTTNHSGVPVDVAGLSSGVIGIAAGTNHTCALTSKGGVKCWGDNSAGELGIGSTVNQLTPVDVSGLGSGVSAISAGSNHSCALTTNGGVKCWGTNTTGQLGDGSKTSRLTPVDVSGLSSGVSSISAGILVTCAVTTGGAAKCWGTHPAGVQSGERLTPGDIGGLSSGVAGIVIDGPHGCVVTTGAVIKCWGLNSSGQLGDGTLNGSLAPVEVKGLASLDTAPATLGTVPGVRSQPSIIDFNSEKGAGILPGIINALAGQLLPNNVSAQQNGNGTIVLDAASATKLAFIPVSYSAGSSGFPFINRQENGQFRILTNVATINVAPALVAVEQAAGLFPDAIVRLYANGTMSARIDGATFVIRPDIQVQSGYGGPARLANRAGGTLAFIDNAGNLQTLYPSFLDPDLLKAAVQSAYSNAVVNIEDDGTATVKLRYPNFTQTFTLVPDWVLGTIPAEHAGQLVWQEGPNRFRLFSNEVQGASQGFTVR